MRWFRSHRVPRVLSSLAALSLFLTGTNYCMVGLISANGPPVMACHAMPRPDDGPTCAAHCGQAAPARHPAPGPVHTPPCCIAMTPVESPALATPAPSATGPVLVAFALQSTTLSTPVVWYGHFRGGHSPPASHAARVPFSGRAPPLS